MKRFMLVSLLSCILVGQTSCFWSEALEWITGNGVTQGVVTGCTVPALLCGAIHACKKGTWMNQVLNAALEAKNVAEVVAQNPSLSQLYWCSHGWFSHGSI